MNKIIPLFTLITAFLFAACGESEKEPEFKGPVKPETPAEVNQEFPADGLGGGISFTAEGSWTASVADATKADPWIDIDPKSGEAGKATIHITLQENRTGSDRSAEIVVTCLGSQTTFTVKQTATNENGDAPGLYFKADGGAWSTAFPETASSLAVESRGGVLLTLDVVRKIADLPLQALDLGKATYESPTFPHPFDPSLDLEWSSVKEVNFSSLTSAVLPANVHRLGYGVFAGSPLEVIDLSVIDSIGRNAFADCKKLTAAELSYQLRTIGPSAFENSGLQELSLPANLATIGERAFSASAIVTVSAAPSEDALEINKKAFAGCQWLRNLNLGSREIHIGEEAFAQCIDLRQATLDHATEIGARAFAECSLLAGVTTGAGTKQLSDESFAYCPALTSVTLSEGLTEIGPRAFSGCTALTGITLPKSLTAIGDDVFQGTGVKYLLIPENVERIGTMSYLTSVDFETEKLTEIPADFMHSSELKRIELPESIVRIGNRAFNHCYSLRWFKMGSRVETIGAGAFTGCMTLDAMICGAVTPPVCGDTDTFLNVGYPGDRPGLKICQLHIPKESIAAYQNDPGWRVLLTYFFIWDKE